MEEEPALHRAVRTVAVSLPKADRTAADCPPAGSTRAGFQAANRVAERSPAVCKAAVSPQAASKEEAGWQSARSMEEVVDYPARCRDRRTVVVPVCCSRRQSPLGSSPQSWAPPQHMVARTDTVCQRREDFIDHVEIRSRIVVS
jgi:hypothetical protein